MTKAITVRLDETDHAALVRQAGELKVQPGTLARMFVHAGLTESHPPRSAALAAIARLTQRSANRAGADAVALVSEARVAIGGGE
jgi:hypothetical protein